MQTSVSASVCSPQVTEATKKDGGASYASTCLRCLPQVWQRNCTVYIQQHQNQFGRLSFAHVDWSVSTDLISLWYLGRGCTRFHACPPCWWGEVLSLQGTPVLFRGAFRYNRVYRYGQEYRYTVPPVKNTGNIGINHPSCIYIHTCTPAAVDFYSITVRMLDSAE